MPLLVVGVGTIQSACDVMLVVRRHIVVSVMHNVAAGTCNGVVPVRCEHNHQVRTGDAEGWWEA